MLAMIAELLGSTSELLWLFAVPRAPRLRRRRHVTVRERGQVTVVPLVG